MRAIIEKQKGQDSIIKQVESGKNWGSIMVRNIYHGVNERGVLSTINKVGFITGRLEELESIVKKFNLKEGDDFSTKAFPVKILIVETTTPDYEGRDKKVNPTTGEVLTYNGDPIYRYTTVVPVGSQQEDSFLMHDVTPVTAETTAQAVDFEARV